MPNIVPGGRYCMYLRRSRADEDAERMGAGETLSRHCAMLQELACRIVGHPIPDAAIYREIVSGDTIADRPQMRRLLSDVERGIWDGVFVAEIDRLARGDTMDQGLVAQTFMYTSTLILTPLKIYDPTDPADSEFFEMRLFMARREYQVITRRMQTGRANAVKEGLYAGSRAPYGYERYKFPDRRGWSLRVLEDQAAVVRMIYDWYLHGINGQSAGSKVIALRLNEMGFRTSAGKLWEDDRIIRLLRNPIYAGFVTWNKRVQKVEMVDGQKHKKRVRSDSPICVRGLHIPIISESDYAAALKRIESRQVAPVPSPRAVANPLAGLARCGYCGRAMRYFCPSSRPASLAQLKCSNPNPCGCHGINFAYVIDAVFDTLRQWSTYDQSALPAPADELPDSTAALRASAEKQLATLRTQLSRLRDLLEQGVYDVDTYLERERELRSRIAACESSISQLQPPPETHAEAMARLAPVVRSVLDAYATANTPAEQNALLKSVISRIVYRKSCKTPPGENPADYLELDVYPRFPDR